MGRPSATNRLRILQVHARDKPIDRTNEDAVLSQARSSSMCCQTTARDRQAGGKKGGGGRRAKVLISSNALLNLLGPLIPSVGPGSKCDP